MPRDPRLTELVNQIDAMVDVAASDRSLQDDDLRRVLRFISQVVQVVEQAFQDVLTLLIEIKFLEESDIHSEKMVELRKATELLTARSYYRDAAEICSRLKHLGENFNQFVKPSVQHLPGFSDWSGVFSLIEHREGRIIMLVESLAWEISRLLDEAAVVGVIKIRERSQQYVDELRPLLSELRELNSRILGFSGSTGLLELTRNRHELEREVKIMIDKRDQSVTHGHRVSIGDDNTFHGHLTVATSVTGSFNTINNSGASPELKDQLRLLVAQVEELLKQAPEALREEIKQDSESLVAEATKNNPRKKWYELSADGLVEAAKACAGAASPVIATVRQVVALLSGVPA